MKDKMVTSVVLDVQDRAYVEFAAGLLNCSRSELIRTGAVAHAVVTIRGMDKLDEFVGFLESFRLKHGIKNDDEVKRDDEDDKGVGDLVECDREQPDIA